MAARRACFDHANLFGAILGNNCFQLFVFIVPSDIVSHEKSFNLELEGNCDFSSNNNIWARFYEFLWRPF